MRAKFLRSLLRFPTLKRIAQRIVDRIEGLPPVTQSSISGELLQQLIGNSRPVIFDIGCNDGGHTLWFLSLFEDPRVYCCEPDPRAIARFKQKVGERPNVQLFEGALSDHVGEITFYQSGGSRDSDDARRLPDGWDYSGSIKRPAAVRDLYPWITFDHSIQVKTETLDALCQEQGVDRIDLIWMDVQGAELDVLRGAQNMLSKTRFIYMEYSAYVRQYEGQPRLKQLLDNLPGFDVIARYPSDILLKNTSPWNTPNGQSH